MLNLRKVAVTGGLASGKSAVCRILQQLGACVVSADEIVHQLLSFKTHVGKQVVDLLGPEIVTNNQIDRALIAERVFKNSQLLQHLEQIVHPAVFKEIQVQYQAAEAKKVPLFVVEIPLLFETEFQDFFDVTISVIANEHSCFKRFQLATGQENTEYLRRSERQLSQQEKASRADFIIENNGTLQELEGAVRQLYPKLIKSEFKIS